MNRYEQLPLRTKWIFFLVGLAPTVYAGWHEHSWLIAAAVFFGGWVLAYILRHIAATLCARFNKLPDGETNMGAFHECWIGPFMLAGPAGAGIVAWAVLAYVKPS